MAALDADAVELVYSELEPVAAHWHVLGIMLMMDGPFLSGLEGREAGESLRALLVQWLATEAPQRRSWRTLVRALNSSALGQKPLAARLRLKHLPAAEGSAEGVEGGSEDDDDESSGAVAVQTANDAPSEQPGDKVASTEQPGDKVASTEQSGDEASTTADQLDVKESTTADQLDDKASTTEQLSDDTSATADQAVDETSTTAECDGNSHVFSERWSRLPREEIVDRVKGVIYGQAIGDALGLATEFMSAQQAKKVYGKKGPATYKDIINDFHRSRWDEGDWTDDTDQMLLILLMVVESGGRVDVVDFARRLYDWALKGYQELGDIGGMGIGITVKRTLNHPFFLERPHEAAKEVWERSGRYLAANGAVMRTSILGALSFNDIEKVVANTSAVSQCTHADPRCTASCVAVTTAIALMLQGDYNLSKKDHIKRLVDTALSHATRCLELDAQTGELRDHMTAKNLGALKLDDKQTIGYTFKALGAGFYALREGKDFEKTVREVIMQGGDADSNASVCGALLGCKLGYRALPPELMQFPHRAWLDGHVESFLKTVGLA